MNKAELIAAVAENAELTKKDAEKAVKAFMREQQEREETRILANRCRSQLPKLRNSKQEKL